MNTLLSFGLDELIALGPDGSAPTELRLLRCGENRTAKGVFMFDDVAAQRVMTRYAEMGRAWVIADYDHGSLQKTPVDPSRSSRAAGTARLELRDGELWAVNIKWTSAAKAAIEAGEWPSISPAFAHDDDGRPNWLINFGLTGNPATYAPAELIAANVILERLDALSAALSTTTTATTTTSASTKDALTTPTRPRRIFTGSTKMRQTELGMLMAAKGKTAADLAKALGIEELEAMSLMMGEDEDNYDGMGLKPTMCTALSIASGSDDKAVEARAKALVDTEVKLLSVTGEKSSSSAFGVIEAWKENAGKAKGYGEQLAKIEAERLAARVDTLLSAAVADKKITKPEIDGKDGKGGLRAKGLQDPEWLEAHLSTREPIAALAMNYEQPQTKPKDGSGAAAKVDVGDRKYEALSGRELAQIHNEAPEQYAALKADWEKRGQPLFTSLRVD